MDGTVLWWKLRPFLETVIGDAYWRQLSPERNWTKAQTQEKKEAGVKQKMQKVKMGSTNCVRNQTQLTPVNRCALREACAEAAAESAHKTRQKTETQGAVTPG